MPAVVDLAAMRDAMKQLGGDPSKINPIVPVDLVIDHSIMVDNARTADALEKNEAREFERNKERFAFLKWGSTAFEGLTIVPPGNGIVHQVWCSVCPRAMRYAMQCCAVLCCAMNLCSVRCSVAWCCAAPCCTCPCTTYTLALSSPRLPPPPHLFPLPWCPALH